MPAKIHVSTGPETDSLEAFESHLRAIYRKHVKAATGVRIERRKLGAGSGPLVESVEAERDDGESDDDLVESVVAQTLAVIRKDMARPRGRNTPNHGRVTAWSGVAMVVDRRRPVDKRVLDQIPLEVEDPDAFVSVENESALMLKASRETLKSMGDVVVAIYRASEKRDKAFAKMSARLAKSIGKSSKAAGRWGYKKAKVDAETERHAETARERAAKSRHFWEAFESVGVEYKDVVAVWSKYWTRERRPGDPPPAAPTRPTPDEMRKVFGDGKFDDRYTVEGDDGRAEQGVTLQGVIAEMVAEPDARRRQQLASKLARVMGAMSSETRDALKLRMLQALGEARALEIAAWLSLPVT